MDPLDAPFEQLDALEQGRAFAELSWFRRVRVTGADARGWLHDLITTDVDSLRTGQARRSLLLSPTGRIRADFSLGSDADGFVLLQAAGQPEHVDDALAPYVLSSAVSLIEADGDLSVFAVPGDAEVADVPDRLDPSVLGTGVDLLTPTGESARRLLDALRDKGLVQVGSEALEVWRVRHGRPRMGVDFDEGSLPAEAGLDATIDATKGCFLGQESVAKVRNLGHPPRMLAHVRASRPIAVGSTVAADGAQVGTVTSAVADGPSGTVAIVRIRWEALMSRLMTGDGVPLIPIGSTD